MTDALTNFRAAAKAVAEGRLDDARAMKDKLLKSDWSIIEKRIAQYANRSDDEATKQTIPIVHAG